MRTARLFRSLMYSRVFVTSLGHMDCGLLLIIRQEPVLKMLPLSLLDENSSSIPATWYFPCIHWCQITWNLYYLLDISDLDIGHQFERGGLYLFHALVFFQITELLGIRCKPNIYGHIPSWLIKRGTALRTVMLCFALEHDTGPGM